MMVFFERPISGPIMGIALLLFVLPALKAVKSAMARRRAGTGGEK
jgi:putative effector of murein hydrolase LrgA (UPF0299 family)